MPDWVSSLPTMRIVALTVGKIAFCVAAPGVIPADRKPSTGMASREPGRPDDKSARGATVRWDDGRTKPRTRQLSDAAGEDRLGRAFWGLLFGMTSFFPFVAAALGAATGTLAGTLSDIGIKDQFINARGPCHPRHVSAHRHGLRRRSQQDQGSLRRTPTRRAAVHKSQRGNQEATLREVFVD